MANPVQTLFYGGLTFAVFLAVLSLWFEIFVIRSNYIPDLDYNMTETDIIRKNKVRNAITDEIVLMESFWKETGAVIVFFRRFGCAFSRVYARELSSISDYLFANDVKLIGIGLEDLGKEDFIDGGFFDGELYIDDDLQCYSDLKYKRFTSLFTIVPAMITSSSRRAVNLARKYGVGGDLQGDIYQVGGLLVVGRGGELLYSQKQKSLADHADMNEVLKSLGLNPEENVKFQNAKNPKENSKFQNVEQCSADVKTEASACG